MNIVGHMTSITRKRLLQLAAARIGNTALAARLGVPVAILKDWLAGETELPDGKLAPLVDLLDETDGH
jgi:hypothetical protein